MNWHTERERAICALICRSHGIRAKEIASALNMERRDVNHELYNSPLMQELCYQDRDYRWHGIVGQERPHRGLHEYAGYYGFIRDFRNLSEEEWLTQLSKGCTNIGRNLNDNRGLFHSFRDCREQIIYLCRDLSDMLGERFLNWEICFEFRLKQSRYVRIYADVLIITEDKVFSLEFKMKNRIEADEVLQSVKYTPYLEILFGPDYEIIPVLVLTKTTELFSFQPIGETEMLLPVCSADMLFNVFDEYLGFLN